MEQKARLFNIQHFSLHDGPGIRTSVFLKGCPLRCFWCHNPESFLPYKQIQFFGGKCSGCGRCALVCPNARDGKRVLFSSSCSLCGECVRSCWSLALAEVGREVSLGELFEEIASDRDLYEKSGGGVTFTGGEPLMQHEFLYKILKQCKAEGINTALETSLFADYSMLEKLLPFLDYIYCDLKVLDDEKHRVATGVSNERILHNLVGLAGTDKDVTVRIPVVPGFNDNEEDMEASAVWLASLPRVPPVEMLPFHGICVGKYEALDMEYPAAGLSEPSRERMGEMAEVFKAYNINIVGNGLDRS